MQKLRWGVLGTGRIVAKGGGAIQQAVNSEWLGVAGRTAETSRIAAETYGVPRFYSGYAELLEDPEIDAVYIALLNHLHAEWAVRALQAGKHVLLEKPFCLNVQEARLIAESAASSGRYVEEGHVWRYQEAHHAAKKMIRLGKIGDICEFRGHFSFVAAKDSTRWVREWGGGSLYDVGCYPLAWSRFFMDGEPDEVDARITLSEATGVDRRFSGTLYYPEGRTAFISSALDMGLGSSYEILGTKGRLSASYRMTVEEVTIRIDCGGETKEWTTDRIDPYKRQVEHFAAAVSGLAERTDAIRDATGQTVLIDALLQSAQTGNRVVMK